jgi:hypothetical protein
MSVKEQIKAKKVYEEFCKELSNNFYDLLKIIEDSKQYMNNKEEYEKYISQFIHTVECAMGCGRKFETLVVFKKDICGYCCSKYNLV